MFACGCGLLIFRCIALHPLVLGLQICCLFPYTLMYGLGCLDIRLNIQFFLFNMRFSRYVSDWHFYQSFAGSSDSNSQITGKNQLYRTALPCWRRLTHSLTQASLLPPPIGTCLFYIKHSLRVSFLKESGSHLLSHAVTSIVPSAAWVLTIVFGMGTGVTLKRIATSNHY